MSASKYPFETLEAQLQGDLFYDLSWRLLYATDASVYREIPEAVCRPAHDEDILKVLSFCRDHGLPIVPRTAGTSLAGQVVGAGLVMDFSKYMNRILEINTIERWVRVQPGVILDDLNDTLKEHGLFFGPETSTSNRCMIGGMIGNNACGSHSLVYGSTRDHTLEITAILSDGSKAVFGSLSNDEFRKKCIGNSLENKIYRHIFELLSDKSNQHEIQQEYPDPRIKRRNTGYALDLLLHSALFLPSREPFNFCKLLAGSEGSLAIFTEMRLALVDLPPPEKALVCVHLNTVEEALQANLIALNYQPVAVELIDNIVLECTKANITHRESRFFLQGDPGAILAVEFAAASREEIVRSASAMEADMRSRAMGYHFPILYGQDISRVWALRKAGLGLLSNVPGNAKPVAVIEDVAVHVEELPGFINELQAVMNKLGLKSVYYAHIGSGELHLRPMLDLKNPADVERFYQVARETALLVKKYRGSLSGEHGDGRLRAEFIPIVLSEHITQMLNQLKQIWDPQHLLNPGKIVMPPSMRSSLRYTPGQTEKKLKCFFSYEEAGSFLMAVEKCNGSGDCRKPHNQGGVMCPSYQASLNEYTSTRGRANLLREFITHSPKKNPFDHQEIINILQECLSCKACKSECPSNVDMAKYKAEALQQYYLENGVPFRSRVIGAFSTMYQLGSRLPRAFNLFATIKPSAWVIKKVIGFAQSRPLPLLYKTSLRKWADKNLERINQTRQHSKQVFLFCDEFTNLNDTLTGIHAILLLHTLGYTVNMPRHEESGRAMISKGLLKKARMKAKKNIMVFAGSINAEAPLVGIEPSAILGFRDEYPCLLDGELREKALEIAKHTFTFEEFICSELEKGAIDKSLFSDKGAHILFHGHCHQKALSSNQYSIRMMTIPANITVEEIQCGCCGMAGAFGYEKEHYELSMAIGELALFPAIRRASANTLIAASGTSCRAQILDGTARVALHPIDILYGQLIEKPDIT